MAAVRRISLNAVPKLTVFEFSSSVSDVHDWNLLLELLGTVGNSMSEVFSRLQGRPKFNSRKLLFQIHLYLCMANSNFQLSERA
jgi:hypothetical protein